MGVELSGLMKIISAIGWRTREQGPHYYAFKNEIVIVHSSTMAPSNHPRMQSQQVRSASLAG